MAYTSINQIGFMLIGISCGNSNSIVTAPSHFLMLDGFSTTLVYLLVYIIMNIGFLVFFLTIKLPAKLHTARPEQLILIQDLARIQ